MGPCFGGEWLTGSKAAPHQPLTINHDPVGAWIRRRRAGFAKQGSRGGIWYMRSRARGWLRPFFWLPLLLVFCPAALCIDPLRVGEPPRAFPAAPGEIIVQFKDGTPSNTRSSVLSRLGTRLKRHGYRNAFEVVT